MTTHDISGKIKLRRDSFSNWSTENPVLLDGELGIETDTGRGKVGDGSKSWNNLTYVFNRNSNRYVEFIIGTQISSTGSFTGVTQDISLYDGKCINYYLPFNGNGNATLELTFPNNTKSGAKPIYILGSKRLTTEFNAEQVFMMCYSLTKDAWYCGNYSENIESLTVGEVNEIFNSSLGIANADVTEY